ncbi:MAG: DUF2147 domain-containing protein [Thermoanaerobaculia bacterium]
MRKPLRSVLALCALLVLAAPLLAQDTEADRVLGLWKTAPDEDGEFAHVEITVEGGVYSGRIVWLSEPEFGADQGPKWAGKAKVDRNNPDLALRGRPIIGLEMVGGFTYDGDDRWTGGTIYDPKKGKTYSCRMTLQDDGSLDLRGYVLGMPFLGRTTTWTRPK